MAKVVQDFSKGVMNQDVDKRLLPNGMLRSVTNGRIIDTDGDNSGVIESIGGTEEILREPFLVDERGNVIGKILGSAAFEDEIYVIGYGAEEYSLETAYIVKGKYICQKNENNKNTGNKMFTEFVVNGNGLVDQKVKLGTFDGATYNPYSDSQIQRLSDIDFKKSENETLEYIKYTYSDYIDPENIQISGNSEVYDDIMCPLPIPEPIPIITLTTIKNHIYLTFSMNTDLKIDWGDGIMEDVPYKEGNIDKDHEYNDNIQSHDIIVYGTSQSLESFKCGGQNVLILDVSKNEVLTSLTCGDNLLTNIDLSKNLKLRYLDCNSNQLDEINIINNITLGTLSCNSNNIKHLDVLVNINLKDLNCSKNPLGSLNVSKNINLNSLTCNDNNLPSLDISALKKLKVLNCHNNQLASLDIYSNPLLERFNCSNNRLTSIDLTNCPELFRFNCSSNNISTLNLSKQAKLDELICTSCKILQLDVSFCLVLKNLDCAYCPITSNIVYLTDTAISLPDRTGKREGVFLVKNGNVVKDLFAICNAKNWALRV